MIALLKLELRRMLRNTRFLVFTLIFPAGFYLLYTRMYSAGGRLDGTTWGSYYMVSMAVFGVAGAALGTLGTRLAAERAGGWVRLLRTTPLPAASYFLAKLCAAVPTTLLLMALGAAVNHIALAPGGWLTLFAGAIPFAALGLMLGYLFDQEYHLRRQDLQAADLVLSQSRAALRSPRGLLAPLAALSLPIALALWLYRPFPAAALALLALAAALAFLTWPRRAAEGQRAVAAARSARRAAEERLAALAGRLETAGELGLAAEPGALREALTRAGERRSALAAELEACRRREEAEQALRQAEGEAAALPARCGDASRGEQEAIAAWRRWCEEQLLPEDMPNLLADLGRADDLLRRLQDAERERDALAAALQAWQDRVDRLCDALRIEAAAPHALARLQSGAESAEELLRAERALSEREDRQRAAAARERERASDRAGAAQRWQDFCAVRALPALPSPDAAAVFMQQARAALAHLLQAQALRLQEEGLARRSASWEQRARALCAAAAGPRSSGWRRRKASSPVCRRRSHVRTRSCSGCSGSAPRRTRRISGSASPGRSGGSSGSARRRTPRRSSGGAPAGTRTTSPRCWTRTRRCAGRRSGNG